MFLFFYGLERRALVDALGDPAAKSELPAISVEVRRLIELYQDNRSFYGYATAFADIVDVLMSDAETYASPPPEATNYWEMPARLKVGLAQRAVEGKPIPADWAPSPGFGRTPKSAGSAPRHADAPSSSRLCSRSATAPPTATGWSSSQTRRS